MAPFMPALTAADLKYIANLVADADAGLAAGRVAHALQRLEGERRALAERPLQGAHSREPTPACGCISSPPAVPDELRDAVLAGAVDVDVAIARAAGRDDQG